MAVATALVLGGCIVENTPVDLSRAELVIEAYDNDFDLDHYELPEGEVQLGYVQRGRLRHTLRIEDDTGADLGVFLVVGGGTGDEDVATISLPAGTYAVYCDLAGHRAAGMEARLDVTPASTTSTTRRSEPG